MGGKLRDAHIARMGREGGKEGRKEFLRGILALPVSSGNKKRGKIVPHDNCIEWGRKSLFLLSHLSDSNCLKDDERDGNFFIL